MRNLTRQLVAVAVASVLVGLLAGCAADPAPTPTASTATDGAVFASEEEALAAATEAFTAYQALSSTIAHDGGSNPERISAYTTGDVLATELESFRRLAANGERGVGQLAFDSLTVQDADLMSGSVDTYLCLDVSKADIVDTTGVSTAPVDRPLRFPLQVGFAYERSSGQLLVEKSESWSGTNFC